MGFWCSIGFSRLCFRPLAVKGEEGSARNPNTVPVCISSHLPRRQHLCRQGRCRWQPFVRPSRECIRDSLGHLILVNTGHHVVTYLQDKVFGNVSFVVIQKKGGAHQTGFKACPLLTTAAGSGPLWAALGRSLCCLALQTLRCEVEPLSSLACGKGYGSVFQLSSRKPQNRYSVSIKSS